MKKQVKKLGLAKETLCGLEDPNLERAAGGTTERCGSGNIGCEITQVLQFTSAWC